MKKIILGLLFATSVSSISAQSGLERIIVERYYVSDSNDTQANSVGGILPVNSNTYRIYVDMLPGYKFQAAYGVDVLPLGGNDPGDHELRLETNTAFFNNEDYGSTSPNYTKAHARNNTVMLDSWFSVGAGCLGNFGVQKSVDDSVATIVNNYTPMVLQNNDTAAGIPLTVQDGLLAGSPESVTFVGFTPATLAVFDNSQAGNLVSTWDASWASLNGSTGPDTSTNVVLIAQVTTDGIFHFKLNIQLGTPGGGIEQIVPDNAVGAEVVNTDLEQTILPVPTATFQVQEKSPFSVVLYPNPAQNSAMLQVETKRPMQSNHIAIYNVTGNKTMDIELPAINGRHTQALDLSSLASGFYVLEADLGGTMTRQPFVKQ